MKLHYAILIILLMLTAACEPIIGTYNYTFYGNNSTTCHTDCMDAKLEYSCQEHHSTWYKHNKTETCNCTITHCIFFQINQSGLEVIEE